MLHFENLDFYCERVSSDFWAEPLNAISNVSFLVAAVILFLYLQKNKIKNYSVWFSAVLIFLIGIGSFLFHTFADELTYYFDVVPIFIFQVFILHEILNRVFQYKLNVRLIQMSVFILATLILSSKKYLNILNGSLGYIPSIVFLIFLSVISWQRKLAIRNYFLGVTMMFLISLCFRSFDMQLCSLNPYGLHMIWHILNSIVLYLLVKIRLETLMISK